MKTSDLIPFGIEVIQTRFGLKGTRFLRRLAKKQQASEYTIKRLGAVGQLVGLSALEVEDAVSESRALTISPHWVNIVLAGIALIGTLMIIRNYTYAPGTMYASISPVDFKWNQF